MNDLLQFTVVHCGNLASVEVSKIKFTAPIFVPFSLNVLCYVGIVIFKAFVVLTKLAACMNFIASFGL